MQRRAARAMLVCLGLLLASATSGAAGDPAPAPAAVAPQAPPPQGLARWFDPDTAPFIPVPEIDIDPVTGTTLGIIPTTLVTDDQGEIKRIYAPDIIHSEYFGWGARARVFAYPSADTQWSLVGGAKEYVESEFDGEYQAGRLRNDTWSLSLSAVYDRSGTPRFYGIGDDSRSHNVSVYTDQQEYLAVQLGWNITHNWQLAWRVMPREVTITAGLLRNFPSTTERFPDLLGIGTTHEFLNRALLSYDTRDDLTIPTSGAEVVIYGGVASDTGSINDSLFSEAGVDWREYWTPMSSLTWAAHSSLRYMPTAHQAPFWALSSIGGDESIIGGDQPLRAYGQGRFYDRNSFSASLEMRQRVASFDAVATHIELQVTPFVDTGSVFARTSTSPLTGLHTAVGVGIRAVARPFVVGYVDVGVGNEGAAVFTGINFPF
jgi:hypothetical protein